MEITLDLAQCASYALAAVVTYYVLQFSSLVLPTAAKQVNVDATLAEPPQPERKFDLLKHEKAKPDLSVVKCWDPSTLTYLGEVPVTSPGDVELKIKKCRAAQEVWAQSTMAQRRLLMKTMLRFVVENQATIAKVAVRDSGKTVTDAIFGEVLVTCEKLKWLATNGESVLANEGRATGSLVWFTKKVWVEYRPLGVIGAIVPWNYPFHNVFNPVSAALMAGNGIVVKVSPYASWSAAGYFGAALKECLKSVGAPEDLVQIVHGYGPAGVALVGGGIDKCIFVGSPGVGKIVMATAAKTLTPVVLELGGKDPFVVCDDVGEGDLDRIAQIALRGVFQSMGQNCAGPERFFVGQKVYAGFCQRIKGVADQLQVGASNDDASVDCGAVTMGSLSRDRLQGLVDDAVSKGARILSQGRVPAKDLVNTSFFPPTVLVDVPMSAKIASEEIFGPIMCVFVATTSDADAVAKANACSFGLSSCAFASSTARAKSVASQLKAGMSSVNDLEGTTYLSQSLPFGGVGESGFDKFAGPEGLRGMCLQRACCEDRVGFLRTSIPPPLHYPSQGKGQDFAMGLVELFYGNGLTGKVRGILKLIKAG